MASESLAVKYRPRTWDQVEEQDTIKQILNEQIRTNQLKRVLLFTGPAGCGKTTSGRIFARTVEPCKANIIEINAADHTGVDDVRVILDQSKSKPLQGKYKVFIVDECFSADTLVNTISGLKKIKDITIGEEVNNLTGTGKVIGSKVNEVALDRLCKLTLSNHKEIFTTKDHRFYTQEGWKCAKDINDSLLHSINGLSVVVKKYQEYEGNESLFTFVTEEDKSNGFVNMYDLQIDSDPSYFVEGVCVHNCHMLTVQAQNSFLKILEEPPAHCIYILCTTDPQKILGTILSRAYRYDFQKISHAGIVKRLQEVLTLEKESESGCGIQSWDTDSLNYIAKTAAGHMRDALTLAEKIIGYTKNITVNDVITVLGVTSYDILFRILEDLISKNQTQLMQDLEEVYRSGRDLKLFVKNFLSFVIDVNKYITLKSFDYIAIPNTYQANLMRYTEAHREYLKYLLGKLMTLNADIKWETNTKMLLESSFLLEVL